LDEECQDLLKHYEESGGPDIADHLIESLDAAHRWEELMSKMNFMHSSRKSWAPLISSRLLKKSTARQEVRMPGSYAGQNSSAADVRQDCLPHPFTEEEISAALQKTKPATAPGYDIIHVEFLKNLGPTAHTCLSKFFSRIMATVHIPSRRSGERPR